MGLSLELASAFGDGARMWMTSNIGTTMFWANVSGSETYQCKVTAAIMSGEVKRKDDLNRIKVRGDTDWMWV